MTTATAKRLEWRVRCPSCQKAVALDLEGVLVYQCPKCRAMLHLERRGGIDIKRRVVVT